ncbi:hypothetical protein [Phyllobacterium sp. YR531]|uniref:hypothetical protein n=1 Tax=Phyllobacterium sp. YR531 TaxID=1144343 RepID=UPI00026F52F9|nr:hypothetical protein [Phyllobacterium sp. YR531]EJM98728.1 hypothetical protein PMI41_04488 [Phyllobacterium sp. YR531]
MGVMHSEFVERLRQAVQEHEERIVRLENGDEKVFRSDRDGQKEDISLQTADHYRRLSHHLREVISRHDLKTGHDAETKKQEHL